MNMTKHYLKHSDTCGCKYMQTLDNDVWGSEETYTNPDGKTYTSLRCAVHASIPFADLNAVLMTECRARNLAASSLKDNKKLKDFPLEDLMARATFIGKADARIAKFNLPELTKTEKTAELAKLNINNVSLT